MNALSNQLRNRRRDASGQVLVLFALMLVVLLLASALAVDYGGWLVAKRNQQNVTDSAALAGAQQLTRPLTSTCVGGTTKATCARQAAWQVLKSQLGLSVVNATTQGTSSTPQNTPYTENGWKIWVASPPTDAGTAYLGHVGGPGNVYVRIDHAGQTYLTGIAGINRSVTAWSTAGRFPANFAVIGMCSPTSVTANCLAGDANIKIDGTGSNLVINTGDMGTNRWPKTGGTDSAVALGSDSNAYMQLFDNCWYATGNQCNLYGYSGGAVDTSTVRSALPLGAPIPNPSYAAPTISSTTAPNQCRGTGTVQLASTQVLEQPDPVQVADLPIRLASAVQPSAPGAIVSAANKIDGTVVYGGTGVSGLTVDIMSGSTVVKSDTTSASGTYSMSGVPDGTYTVRVSDSTDLYNTTTVGPYTWNANAVVPTITVVKNALVTGTVRNATTSAVISGATVTITVLGINYVVTTNASGVYSRRIPTYGTTVAYSITVAATGYTSGSGSVSAPTGPLEVTYTRDFSLVPTPASMTGTITDAVTGLAVPGVTVTLGTGGSGTTNSAGVYTIASVVVGTTTITLSGTSMVGYAYSTPTSGSSITIVAGANTRNFTVWPKGCYDGSSSGSFGSWSCSWPSGNNCPATSNLNGTNVTCTFTQANAIRPGTYNNITLPNGTCAWIDPKGGVTGLPSGQMAGIVHVKGTISIGSDSYLFGDGVTIVMDQGADIDVNNGGGFVLNFGSQHNTIGDVSSGCNLSTIYSWANHGAGYYPCFRTVDDAQDYAYAAWTTGGTSPWQSNSGSGCAQASTPVYNSNTAGTRCFTPGKDLGITFYLYCPSGNTECGLGTNSRVKLATANMGYLFNGVLYGPGDDIQLGGGKDGQTAAGQIIGWTIEYHGGTQILQNWYGDVTDGQPFLVEPVLGE